MHQLDATANMLRVYRPTVDAACTALLAVSQIAAAEPLLIINGKELIDIDFQLPIAAFNEGGYDGGTATFPSIHPLILKNGYVNGRYYICPTFNEMILDDARLGAYSIELERYRPIKSERQIERLDTPVELGRRAP